MRAAGCRARQSGRQSGPPFTGYSSGISNRSGPVQEDARAILLLALILLGLKSMLGSILRSHADVVGELVNGVLVSVIMVDAFPVLVPDLIVVTNAMTSAIGEVSSSIVMAGWLVCARQE
jgi:hypothetical protein